MTHTLRKIFNISISIISGISNFMLVWMFLSTIEIAFASTYHRKANDYNIFVLSDHIKSNINTPDEKYEIHNYTDNITDYDDGEDDTEDDNQVILNL